MATSTVRTRRAQLALNAYAVSRENAAHTMRLANHAAVALDHARRVVPVPSTGLSDWAAWTVVQADAAQADMERTWQLLHVEDDENRAVAYNDPELGWTEPF